MAGLCLDLVVCVSCFVFVQVQVSQVRLTRYKVQKIGGNEKNLNFLPG